MVRTIANHTFSQQSTCKPVLFVLVVFDKSLFHSNNNCLLKVVHSLRKITEGYKKICSHAIISRLVDYKTSIAVKTLKKLSWCLKSL